MKTVMKKDTASASMSRTKKIQAQPALSNGVAATYPPLSPRSGGLVDYDADEDEEDYRPPPRKQSVTPPEDEGTIESLRLKRKLVSKEEPVRADKEERLGKHSKTKDSVFAALCSTLSQAVLPSKKTASTMHVAPHTADGNKKKLR